MKSKAKFHTTHNNFFALGNLSFLYKHSNPRV